MKYLIAIIVTFITLPVFADECKRDIVIELFDNQIPIDSGRFEYVSTGRKDVKERKIYSFPMLYIDRKLYTIDMQELSSVSVKLIDESGKSVDLYTTVLNRNGVIETPIATFNTTKFHELNNIFSYDIFVDVDKNCSLNFLPKLQVSKFVKVEDKYRIIPNTIRFTL